MAGFQAIASKIKKLSEATAIKIRGKMVSVVFMDSDGNIEWPDNPAPGVLVAPKQMTEKEWVAKYGREGG